MYVQHARLILGVCLGVFLTSAVTNADIVWLDELDVGQVAQDWGDAHRNQSV